MVCTLSVRTSVLVATNPTGRHYDQSKTLPENIKMSDALLSRYNFSLLLDRHDKLLSKHIMATHNGEHRDTVLSPQRERNISQIPSNNWLQNERNNSYSRAFSNSYNNNNNNNNKCNENNNNDNNYR